MNAIVDIRGSGGGNPFAAPTSNGGSGKGGEQGVQSNNTLRSAAFARLVELICEGPIEGLVNGGESIYFNQTPVVNADQTVNFRGVQWSARNGLPDQAGLVGNATAENQTAVNVQCQFNVPPTVVTIDDVEATSARVIVSVPALSSTDNNGNTGPTNVSWQVWCQPSGGAWAMVDEVDLLNQMCTSVYQQQSVFNLPPGGSPWNIKVVRLTPDSYTINLQNQTWFDSYTSVVAGNFIYPNSAVVGLTVAAELFSATSIPGRSFHINGLIIQVPSNYNPTTRIYTGIWDGTFQNLYSSNPAWVLYDLLTNNRYGIGAYIDVTKIDKWSLYTIGQYCDQMVMDGFGGTEPRYAFNGVLNNRQDAWKALMSVTSCFRGMIYWATGQVFTTADIPADPLKLVAPADVVGGHFSYSGTALKTRHSVAMVKWNDPLAFWSPALEVVVNGAQMNQFGWRETNLTAVGCTSRGQANRMGKWILDTEQYSTETIEYVASWDHVGVVPGQIISVADPNKAQVRIGGRIVSEVSSGVYKLDAVFTPTVGETYTMMAELPDGTIGTAAVSSFSGANVTLTADFAIPAAPNTLWVLTGTEVSPMMWRVLSVVETDKHLFKVTALFYDPTKYARVEDMQPLAPIQYHQVKTTIDPPSNFSATETLILQNGVAVNNVVLSWTPSDDFLASSYLITGFSPAGGGQITFGNATATNFTINNCVLGLWTFNIQSVGYAGQVSTNISITFNVVGWAGAEPPTVTLLEVFNGGENTNFGGPDCHVTWQNNFLGANYDAGQEPVAAGAGTGSQSPFYRCNIVTISDVATGAIFRTETVYTSDYIYTFAKNTLDNSAFNRGPQRSFIVTVVVQDTLGNQSLPVSITPDNPPPAVIMPTLTAGQSSIYLNYVNPTDPDYVGAFIWVSTNPTFNPLTTTPTYQGSNNFLAIPALPSTVYYICMAGYDQFGTMNLNISPVQSVEAIGIILDTSAPNVPTDLILSAGTLTLPTGTVQAVLNASWDVSPSTNFSYFNVQIKTLGGSYISYQTASNSFSWPDLVAMQAYSVQVSAVSKLGYASSFCAVVSLTMPAKTTAPGATSSFTVTASLKSAYLQWINSTDTDIDHVEIWRGTTNVQSASTLVGSSYGTGFTQAGLTTGTTYYYWVREVNTSGVAGSYSSAVSVTPGVVATGDIAANSITADRLTAGTITGNLLNISTSLPATITIGSSGVTIGSTAAPAALINAQTTLIGPGLIQLTGATTLSSWQSGSDLTKINGGTIAANTIAANSISVGMRGLTLTNLAFSFNLSTSVISWTAGTISYTDNTNTPQTVSIGAGSVTYTGTPIYIAWQQGATSLVSATTVYSIANYVNMATYSAIAGLIVTYGQTSINGANIMTGSIQAGQIAANTIVAANMAAGTLTATQIAAGSITGDRLVAGTITASQIAASTITGSQISTTAALPGTITVSGTGVTLATMQTQAANPATVVNTGTTKILPGLVTISGTSTLSTWLAGGDLTKIDGGKIYTNSIAANSLKIGARGLGTIQGLDFQANASTNVLSWSAGYILYTDDTGTVQAITISAGSVTYTTQNCYVYWTEGASSLSSTSTNDYATAMASTGALMATYGGGANLQVLYGGTIIDGTRITTGTISSSQLVTGSAVITGTLQLGANIVTIPTSYYNSSTYTGAGSSNPFTLASVNFTLDYAGFVTLLFSGIQSYSTGAATYIEMDLDSSRVAAISNGSDTTSLVMTYSPGILAAGTHNVNVWWWGASTAVSINQCNLIILGSKR